MFTLREEKVDRQFNELADLVSGSMKNLVNVFMKRLEESEKINDVKLLTIEVYTNTLHEGLKYPANLIKSNHNDVREGMIAMNDGNNGNFGEIFRWFDNNDSLNGQHHEITISRFFWKSMKIL
jgi:hypothetical protein